MRRRYGLAERFILYVGTIEPRKNLPKLIEAFAARRRSRRAAASTGVRRARTAGCRATSRTAIERSAASRDAVHFTGYVPFEDLPALYSLAEMFVFPSMYEGFGLPVIEAMACGTPVITGRAAALSEVGGGAVEHVDRLDADALGEALVALAASRERREELSAPGCARSRDVLVGARRARDPRGLSRRGAWPRACGCCRARRGDAAAGRRAAGSTARVHAASSTDVLFGQAYFLRFDPKLWDAQQPYAPLGALYAAACVRAARLRVALFDAMLAESEDEWAAALDRASPALRGDLRGQLQLPEQDVPAAHARRRR